MAAVFRRFIVIVCLMGACGCAPHNEESITFYDEHLEKAVVEELSEARIPFRHEGSRIAYPAQFGKEVDRLFQRALASQPAWYKFVRKEERDQFAAALREAGIAFYERTNEDGTYQVFVKREDNDKAHSIFQGAVLKHD